MDKKKVIKTVLVSYQKDKINGSQELEIRRYAFYHGMRGEAEGV